MKVRAKVVHSNEQLTHNPWSRLYQKFNVKYISEISQSHTKCHGRETSVFTIAIFTSVISNQVCTTQHKAILAERSFHNLQYPKMVLYKLRIVLHNTAHCYAVLQKPIYISYFQQTVLPNGRPVSAGPLLPNSHDCTDKR